MTPVTHEKSDISSSEMSDIIAAAKAKQLEKNTKKAEERKSKTPKSTVAVVNNMDNANHGEYVVSDDGTVGIMIDHEEEINKLRENDETSKCLVALLDEDCLITDANAYKPDYGEDCPDGYDPGVEYINRNPYEPKVQDMIKIKEGFSNLTYGVNGLVDINSEEGKRVSEAIEKLRSGEIVLPTPEEYEQQKREALERRKKREQEKNNKSNNTNNTVSNNEDTSSNKIVGEEPIDNKPSDIDEISMGEMPENAYIKKGVEDFLNEIESNTKNTTKNDKMTTPMVVDRIPVEEEVKKEPPHVVISPQNQPVKKEPPKPNTLNLAALEEELSNDSQEVSNQVNKEPEIKAEDIVTINVPKGEADTVIKNLPIETYDKVVKAKVVKVNEVEFKDVPTATVRITDIARYRELSKRRPSTGTAEVTERVLINSGFIVTLKAATSLEMATIFTSPTSNDVDWEKEYVFCYEHTVATSLGKMSYNEFVKRVSPSDIETILYGIYEISETDSREVSILCGTNDGGCGSSYTVNVPINKLPNLDSLDDKAKERVKEIISVKSSPDETRRVVENSPTSIVKYVKCGEDRHLAIRTTTGNMMIERIDRLNDITSTYGAVIALLLLYVENIRITIKEREDAEPTTILLDTPALICEELLKLSDEEINFVKDIITDDLIEYPTITYSIKGPCICPHCGNVKDNIPCSISDLVFQKAQSVLE